MKMTPGSFLPFLLFTCAVTGVVLGSYCSSLWILAIALVAAFCLSIFFALRRCFRLADSFLLAAVIFVFALWSAAATRQTIDDLCGKKQELTFLVTTLPVAERSRQVCAVKIDGFEQTVRVLDGTKSLKWRFRYRTQGMVMKKYYQERAYYSLQIRPQAVLEILPLSFWEKITRQTAFKAMDIFRGSLNDQAYRLLSSLILGRYELVKAERRYFIDAGSIHLLAISGMHVGLVAAFLFFPLGIFCVPYRLRLVIAAALIFLYAFMAGASPSILRAALMYIFLAAGFFLRRHLLPMNLLGLAGIVILVFSPSAFFNIGFQLSFLAMAALIVFPARSVPKYLRPAAISFWVGLVTLPVTAFYFSRVYLAAFLYNLVLIPFCSLIMFLALLFLAVAPLTFCTGALGALLNILCGSFIELNRWLGSLSCSFTSYHLSLAGLNAYYLIFAVAVYSIWRYNGLDEEAKRDIYFSIYRRVNAMRARWRLFLRGHG